MGAFRTPHISVVTPVYGCRECLRELYKRLKLAIEQITADFEIILVNDASPDNAWEVIKQLATEDDRVKGIDLSRNFGQHNAITAGIDSAKGDWVVVMDCDLQDQPEEIEKLYKLAQEGYDVVFGRRNQRQDSLIKKLGSKAFYTVFDYFTDNKSDNSVANFSICSQHVIENFRKLREHNRSFPLFIRWMGFRTAYVDIEHAKRYAGKTTYNFSKLMKFATDSIVAQSNKPLKLSIRFGFLLSFSSIIYVLFLMIRYYFLAVPVEGWTSLMVSIYFVAGLLFLNMGLLGLYIGKIFEETKNRPIYIIKEKINICQERST